MEIAKQALWNYLPFSQMQCLHTITKFESSSFNLENYYRSYLAIANHNNILVYYWNDGYKTSTVCIWDLKTGRRITSYIWTKSEFRLGKKGKVFVEGYRSLLFVFELETQKQIDNYPDNTMKGCEVFGGQFAVCETDKPLVAKAECDWMRGKIEIWNYDTYSRLFHYEFENLTLSGCEFQLSIPNCNASKKYVFVSPLIFTSDGDYLVARFVDLQLNYSLQIWDTQTTELVQTIEDLPKLIITSVGVRLDETIIACGIGEDKVCVWELQSDKIIYTASEMSPCILSTDGRVLIYATASYEIVIRDLVADKELCRLQGHDAPVAYLALSEDRQFLASYSTDRQIKIWGIPNHS